MRKISADDERIELFKQSQFLVISLLQNQSLANFPHVLLQNEFFSFRPSAIIGFCRSNLRDNDLGPIYLGDKSLNSSSKNLSSSSLI